MSRTEDEVRRLLDELPEEVSLEDIQYHLYIRQKIDRGIEDVQAGHTLPEDEVEKPLAKWLER